METPKLVDGQTKCCFCHELFNAEPVFHVRRIRDPQGVKRASVRKRRWRGDGIVMAQTFSLGRHLWPPTRHCLMGVQIYTRRDSPKTVRAAGVARLSVRGQTLWRAGESSVGYRAGAQGEVRRAVASMDCRSPFAPYNLPAVTLPGSFPCHLLGFTARFGKLRI